MQARRLLSHPIITPESHPSIGTNINGPSLIRVPDWLPNPLGRYYLYFAHHQGRFIRLAYADDLAGPWTVYASGTLQLEQTPCVGHIASPDLHVDHEHRRLIMYYHGPISPGRGATPATQRSFVATSTDGVHFSSGEEVLGSSYFRVFHRDDYTYALGMPGIIYRSLDGFTSFEQGPTLFDSNMRHAALWHRGDVLHVFYSNAGDNPEEILVSQIDLKPDWMAWRNVVPKTVLQPETDYEGADLPPEPSARGAIHTPARQLRDPGIFEEDGRIYLLYCVAGERGIAMAEIVE